MYIEDLVARVVEVSRAEVRSGRISERSLAQRAGLSQPHLNNSLHGVRTLSPRAAGQLMKALGITVPDLIWRLPERDVWTPVPLLRGRIGPGADALFHVFEGFAPFPAASVAQLEQPVGVRLAPDSVLPREFHADDLVLLDQNLDLRRAPSPDSCWVVSVFGGLRIRRVIAEAGRILAGHEGNLDHPEKWESISLRGRNILDVVRARLVWIGRKVEKAKIGPAGQTGPRD